MAELAIAVAGLGLSAPELIIAIQQCCDYIDKRVQAYKDAPAVLRELQTFGEKLHQAELKADIELAQVAFASDECDDTLKKSLDEHIKILTKCLDDAQKFTRDVSIDDRIDRLVFSLIYERRGRKINKGLGKWQASFLGLIQLLESHRKLVADQIRLSEDRLQVVGCVVPVFKRSGASEANAILLSGTCEYKERLTHDDGTQIQLVNVLFERLHGREVTEDQVHTLAASLTRHFRRGPQYRGILPCLGYRMMPAELCFQLPPNVHEITSLQKLLTEDAAKAGFFLRRLEDRFSLARALSEAVLSVAATGFVHKSIRGNTIALLQTQDVTAAHSISTRSIGMPILTTWQYLRKVSTLSKRANLAEDWVEDVYRHPERQGLQVQERYNMGHDIYSLGVCLLEIGLWSPLYIVHADEEAIPSKDFVDAASQYFDESSDSLDLVSKFKFPPQIQNVLVLMADDLLPPRMGSAYAQLVRQCLTCLEGGFGDHVNFRTMKAVEAGAFFNDVVLASCPDISIP